MASQSHSHAHSHSHVPPSASASGASLDDHTHDFVAANKHHHNNPEHVHNHANSVLSEYLATKTADAILDAYDFDPEETTVLDYACGGGLVSRLLASLTKRIVAVDLAQAMVDHFNRQVEEHGVDPSEMIAYQKDVLQDTEEELNGELFDVVFCANAYHHIPDVLALTMALSQRVKPDGVLIIIDLDSESDFQKIRDSQKGKHVEEVKKVVAHKGGFSSKELQELLEKTDRFSEVTVEVASTTKLSEMQALKGKGNWSKDVESDQELELRHLIAVGVRKEIGSDTTI